MKYQVLGPIAVEDGAHSILPQGPKQRALLAILLLRSNQFVSRDVLIDELWGDTPPPGAAHSLEAHISRLRKLLRPNGGQVLVTRPGGYRLDVAEDELDLTRFGRLVQDGELALRAGDPGRAASLFREALSLWRGPPLEDVASEPFAQIETQRLESRRLAAYEDLFEAELAVGRHAEVATELEAVGGQNPLRERLQGQLMLALYRSGRQPEALEVYRTARRHLVAELGLEPSLELRELEQAVLRQDPALAAVAAPAPPSQPHTTPSPRRPFSLRIALVSAAAVVLLAGVVGGLVIGLGGRSTLSSVAPGSVAIIDPADGSIERVAHVGSDPMGLAATDERIWVTILDRRTISRLDESGNLVDVVSTGGAPTAIGAGSGAVWVADGFAGKLVRLDPRTGAVTSSVTLGGHPAAVAADRNGVWVANSVLDAVQEVDPETLEARSIPVGRSPTAVAAGGGSVWVANSLERSLTRIDSATGTVLQRRIPLRFPGAGVAIGRGSVWVTEPSARSVARIDAASGRTQKTIPVGRAPSSVVASGNRLWVANADSHSLTEIDAERARVERTLPIGAAPRALVLAGGRLWVAVGQA
jgi:DNA-binding SARP family transcriptional activator/DNA-binding beta-propeller fold protein YncE